MSIQESEPKPTDEGGRRLRHHLFGAAHDAPGMVGVGASTYFVYLHMSRNKWRGNAPIEWEGVAVDWKYNIGRPVAYAAEGASSVSPEAQSAVGTTPSPPSEGGDK